MHRRITLVAVLAFTFSSFVLSAAIVRADSNPPPFLKPTPTKTPLPKKPPIKKPPVKKPPPRKPVRKVPVFTVPPGWPKVLVYARFKIKAPIEPLSFAKKSDYEAPYRWGDVAWYDRGPRPGDLGRAVIYGHLDSYCCPAIFYQLKNAHTGDIIQVTYRNGKTLSFKVQWRDSYLNSKLPLNFIYGRARERGLVLMTCGGIFHRDGTGYDHKEVVYARVILPNGHIG